MTNTPFKLLLADDDHDDCEFFKEALEELPVAAKLSTVHDGVELFQVLSTRETTLPDAIFLDLNMPRKSGLECLIELKRIEPLMELPIIIYSTYLNKDVIELLYENGAHYYVRKPVEFDKLKKVLWEAIELISLNKFAQPTRDKFILNP